MRIIITILIEKERWEKGKERKKEDEKHFTIRLLKTSAFSATLRIYLDIPKNKEKKNRRNRLQKPN